MYTTPLVSSFRFSTFRFCSISRPLSNAQEITESDIRSYKGKLNKMSASRVYRRVFFDPSDFHGVGGTASLRGR